MKYNPILTFPFLSDRAFIPYSVLQFLPHLCFPVFHLFFSIFHPFMDQGFSVCSTSILWRLWLLNWLAASPTSHSAHFTARPSVLTGRHLSLNITSSPVPKQYLSHCRYSINVDENNDQLTN